VKNSIPVRVLFVGISVLGDENPDAFALVENGRERKWVLAIVGTCVFVVGVHRQAYELGVDVVDAAVLLVIGAEKAAVGPAVHVSAVHEEETDE